MKNKNLTSKNMKARIKQYGKKAENLFADIHFALAKINQTKLNLVRKRCHELQNRYVLL